MLNIFPRRKDLPSQVDPEPEREAPPEPSPEVMAELDESTEEGRRRTRRGSRGGRGRRRPTDGAEGAAEGAETEAESAPAEETPPVRAPRHRTPRAAAAAESETSGEQAEQAELPVGDAPAAEEKPRRAPRSRTPKAAAPVETPEAAAPAPEPVKPAARSTARGASHADGSNETAAILRAMERQSAQIEQLLRQQEDTARRGGGAGGTAVAAPQRVGVFVDAANIELACDRLRARFDWGKVLRMLTRDRQLIRAVAYSPVHDDPGVSMETQRFAEPFLGRGFKVVTKPLKRFSDGTVKANVDIELALDVVAMLDRLDVVCLVSGDGDFQPLVEYVQNRGVRCEVVAVAQSAAMNLKNAADEYIDLAQAQRLKEIRV